MALGLQPGSLTQGYTLPELSSALNIAAAVRPKPDSLSLVPSGQDAISTPPEPPPDQPAPDAPIGDSPDLSGQQPQPSTMPQEVPAANVAPQDLTSGMQAPTPTAPSIDTSKDFYDFENRPIQSIGRALAQFAAGYRGTPNEGPLTAFRQDQIAQQKQQLEQQAMKYKQTEFGLNATEKFLALAAANPEHIDTIGEQFNATFGNTIGVNFKSLGDAVKSGELKDAAATFKSIQASGLPPNVIASALNPDGTFNIAKVKSLGEISDKILETTAVQKAKQDNQMFNVPVGGVVTDAKGNVIFRNTSDKEITHVLGENQILTDNNGKIIARGPAKTEEDKIGNPSLLQITRPDGKIENVMAQQMKDGQWVTADEKRSPVDVGDNYRILSGAAASGVQGGSRAQVLQQRVIGGINLGLKEIPNMLKIGSTGTTGLFRDAGLAGTPIGALARKATPQDDQFMQAATAGLTRALAQTETQGLVPNGTFTASFDKIMPQAGDTGWTRLYKFGAMRQAFEAGAEVLITSPLLTPEQKTQVEGYVKDIARYVPWTPQDVLELERNGKRNPGLTILDYAKSKGLGKGTPAAPAAAPAPSGTDAPEGATATGPGGKKLIKRNGQWVPL